MLAPLPVINEAYERFVQPIDDPTGEIESHRGRIRQRLDKAKLNAIQANTSIPHNDTLPNLELIAADAAGESVGALVRYVICNAQNQAESVTGNVVGKIVKEHAASLFKLYAYASNCAAGRANSTVVYIPGQALWASGSTTAKRPIEESFTWVGVVYGLVRAGQTSKALRTIYASVERYLRENNLVALAAILGEIDIRRLNPQTMTALLRISGRAKEALSSWTDLRDRVKLELVRLNVSDLAGVMAGLDG
jgi:hypothetical protein